ncbi:hypothetical protein V2J09_023411 [Rumex salicifolius]
MAILLIFALGVAAAAAETGGVQQKYKDTVTGIDLGTTYSCVGVYRNGNVDIIANDQGNRITLSWVAFTNTERLIGEAARFQAAANPTRTVFDAKRLIGRKFNEDTVQEDMKMLPYKVVNKDGKPYVEIKVKDGESRGDQRHGFGEDEGNRRVLGGFLGEEAYFNDAQRQATKDAGTTAAALAYGLSENNVEKNILVYDLGGGIEVLSASGNAHLGGEDFDHRIMETFKRKYGKDMSNDSKALGKLRRECERAKRSLSSQHQVRVEIESLFDGVDFSETLTRAKFEEMNGDLFRKTMGPVKKALEDARLKKSQIHEIVLVGGSTRIPKVQEMLKEFFGGKEPSKGVHPDEAVAFDINMVLIDVNPLTLGIETLGGVMTPIVKRNNNTKVFTTYQDKQTSVEIKVFEGERSMSKDYHELGKFTLSGIAQAPRGVPQIEVTFEIDTNGMLQVTAEDKAAKSKQTITITNENNRLSKEEVQRFVEEGEMYAEEYKIVRERVEAKNKMEAYVYNMKSAIDDKEKLGRKIEEEDKEEVERALRDAEEWLYENPVAEKEDLDDKMKELEAVGNPVIRKAYENGGSANMEGDEDHDEF